MTYGDGCKQLKHRTFNHLIILVLGPPPGGAAVTTRKADVCVHTGACYEQTNKLYTFHDTAPDKNILILITSISIMDMCTGYLYLHIQVLVSFT